MTVAWRNFRDSKQTPYWKQLIKFITKIDCGRDSYLHVFIKIKMALEISTDAIFLLCKTINNIILWSTRGFNRVVAIFSRMWTSTNLIWFNVATALAWYFSLFIQCESKTPPPLRFSDNFFKRLGIFNHFCTPIIRSFLHQMTNFYSIISNFDEVMPY